MPASDIKSNRDTNSSWETLRSDYLLKTKWVSVRRDTCRLPGGRVIDDYYVMEMPDGATVVAVTDDQQLVLVKQYKHGVGWEVLELPAGIVDPGEEANAAAMRELLEETGYVAGAVEHVATLISKPARMNARTHVFFAREVHKARQPVESDLERVHTGLVPIPDLPALIASGAIATDTSLAALLMCWSRLAEYDQATTGS